METAKLNNDEYEKVITRTSVNSKMRQLVFLYANTVTPAVKASERRNKPFKVQDYLVYERHNKQDNTNKTTLLLHVVFENDGQSELLATNSNSIITTFLDVLDNLDDLDLVDVTFSIGSKMSKNGREYNILEFGLI